MLTRILQERDAPSLQQDRTGSAIVVLSSRLVVVYANRGGTAVLRDLNGAETEASLQIPAPVLAHLADGILKDIDMRRILRAYAPFSIKCSIQGAVRTWSCRAFGVPPQAEIDRARIVLLFTDTSSTSGTSELRDPILASPRQPTPRELPTPELSLI